MATDPGDLVLDPTCGSGTTAYVAEQWGRRWITIDTSRVALALARARIMGARYPYYLLADSKAGRRKEAEVTRTEPDTLTPTGEDLRQGFVYERVPHITLKSIANNAEIDKIHEPLRGKLDAAARAECRDRQVVGGVGGPAGGDRRLVPAEARTSQREACWQERIERQKEIDATIARPDRTSTSTTSRTRTRTRSAWPGRSRWRASARTA